MRFRVLALLGIAVFMLSGLVSAEGNITNFETIQEFSDFVAGDTATSIFSFDFPEGFENMDNSSLVVVVNITSMQSESPVWKGDFQVDLLMKEFLADGSLEDEIEMQCSEVPSVTLNEFGGGDAILEISNIPNGTFYCFNEDHYILDVGKSYEGTLDVTANPALTPGIYSIEAGLYSAQIDLIGVVDFLALLANWGECPSEGECRYDFDGDGNVSTTDFDIILGLWGEGPEMFLEDVQIDFGEDLAIQLDIEDVIAVETFELSDDDFAINATGFLTNVNTLSIGSHPLDITLRDYLGREKTESMVITVVSPSSSSNSQSTTSSNGGGSGGGGSDDDPEFPGEFEPIGDEQEKGLEDETVSSETGPETIGEQSERIVGLNDSFSLYVVMALIVVAAFGLLIYMVRNRR